MTPDDVLTELFQIRTTLETLAPDSAEYRRLQERRAQLKEMARAAADASRNTDFLQMELEHLERRLAMIDGSKIDVPSWQTAMSKYSINDPAAHAARINEAIDANSSDERATITARIAQIREALNG